MVYDFNRFQAREYIVYIELAIEKLNLPLKTYGEYCQEILDSVHKLNEKEFKDERNRQD